MDHIYRDTPSAKIARLIPIWKQPSDGRLHTRNRTACIRLSRGLLNACLMPIWKQPSDGRLYTAASRYIEQPPHSRLQTAAWRVKKHLSRNSCLTAFSKRLSCVEFQQKLSGGWYDSGYVYSILRRPCINAQCRLIPLKRQVHCESTSIHIKSIKCQKTTGGP